MKRFLSRSLTGLVLAGALSCSAPERKSRTYEYDFDMVPQLLANQMYSLDHNDHDAESYDDLVPYLHSPVDVNENGILDYHLEFTVVKEHGKIVEFSEKVTKRAGANESGRDEVKINRIVFNEDGSFTHYVVQDLNTSRKEVNAVVSEYTRGKHKRALEKTGRILRRLLSEHSTP